MSQATLFTTTIYAKLATNSVLWHTLYTPFLSSNPPTLPVPGQGWLCSIELLIRIAVILQVWPPGTGSSLQPSDSTHVDRQWCDGRAHMLGCAPRRQPESLLIPSARRRKGHKLTSGSCLVWDIGLSNHAHEPSSPSPQSNSIFSLTPTLFISKLKS